MYYLVVKYNIAFELRRKLYRAALKEKTTKEANRLRKYNQNSERRQAVVNCFHDLVVKNESIMRSVSSFLERLVNGMLWTMG